MAIILKVGYQEFLIENVKDAQSAIAALHKATPIENVGYDERKALEKKFGTSRVLSAEKESFASIHIEQSLPISAEKYKSWKQSLEEKEELEKPIKKASPEQVAAHVKQIREVLA